ncbi:MAG: hypothetical protein LBG80_16190 [Bacteroidales bacterium]|nr:hypothetical protein [Bacteroidales bacterium]
MKKIVNFAASLLLLAGSLASCGKDKENVSLKGTNWKLAGFVDMQTEVLTEAQPQCSRCYILAFDTDSTASGYSSTNDVLLDISRMPPRFGGTKMGEMGDGDLYWNIWPHVTSYVLKDGILKFFYTIDKKEAYLLFKPYEQ